MGVRVSEKIMGMDGRLAGWWNMSWQMAGCVCVMEVVSVFVCNCLYVGLHQFMLMSQHCYVNFFTIHIYTHTLLHSHMCVSFFIFFFVNFLCFKMLF